MMQFDTQLIERLLQHDDLAFANFYEQTADVFFRYIVTHYNLADQEAHDILSDVYLKIWDNVDKYDENYTFGQFVRSILKNHCKDYFKKTKPLFFSDLEDDYGNSVVDTKATPLSGIDEKDMENVFDTQFTYEHIQEALELFEPEEQELLHARYVLGYSYDIISDMYGLKNDAVRQKISRIIKKLRKNLGFLEN